MNIISLELCAPSSAICHHKLQNMPTMQNAIRSSSSDKGPHLLIFLDIPVSLSIGDFCTVFYYFDVK